MDIHEYQAKEILQRYGIAIPHGGLAHSPEQASYRSAEIGGSAWVVKAQVHAGGRGQAGGVTLCHTDGEVFSAAGDLFGRRLHTRQSPAGKLVHRVYVEEATDISRELYLGIVLDRASETISIIASGDGGMEIEELAARAPEAIVRAVVEPAVGLTHFQAREIAFGIGLEPNQVSDASHLICRAYQAFTELDATMLEINPLVVTGAGALLAVDATLSFDDNALFRHPELAELRDRSQEDPREAHAGDRGLAYVGLDGDIGCMINGAGLAMATMDMIRLAGGEPANFLDIGGGASPDRVLDAFRAVLNDGNVRAILVNVFAGINRCVWVAEGIVSAHRTLSVPVPVVVRLAGTRVEEGRRMLADSGLPVVTAESLAEAAPLVVEAARNPSVAA